jgi:hypothetical protein
VVVEEELFAVFVFPDHYLVVVAETCAGGELFEGNPNFVEEFGADWGEWLGWKEMGREGGKVLFIPSGFEELILPTITSFLKGRKTIMRNSTTAC